MTYTKLFIAIHAGALKTALNSKEGRNRLRIAADDGTGIGIEQTTLMFRAVLNSLMDVDDEG